MEKYNYITVTQAEFEHSKWRHSFFLPLPDRIPYEKTENNLQISTVSGRVLGIPNDEKEYFFQLYEMYHSPDIYIVSNLLQNTNSTEWTMNVKKILEKAQGLAGLSTKRLVTLLDKEGLIPKYHLPAMENLLRQSLIRVLETLKENYPQATAHPEYRNIIINLLSWIDLHLIPWLNKVDMTYTPLKMIWYGEAEKSHLYFLYFAMLTGSDVLIFNPEGKDQFADIDPSETISFVHWMPESMVKQQLQKEVVSRSETVAYRSSRQLNEVFQQENVPIYKPWQFTEYMPQAVTLRTTYDELYLITKEKAFVRPEFKVGMEKVTIPNVFAQVLGMSNNKKEYWDRIHKLMELEQTRVIRHFPFSEEEKIDYTVFYREVLNKEGIIEPEKLKRSSIWLYQHLPVSRQNAIAAAISRLCKKDTLLPMPGENSEDVRLYLFTQVTNLSEEGLRWIQVFDYAQTVPKMILYYNEQSGTLSRSDAAKLLLLNELGFDIIIYNPPGYASLEQYINKKVFDNHMLDELAFEQKFKNPSLFKKSFGI